MGALYGLSGKKLKDQVEYLLEDWNLKKFRNKKAKLLSGGFKRLLNIACGLINDPSIIFLDEPTVGLDPKIRMTFWEKITKLQMDGKTIILTTHYMDEAQHLCDRIAIIVDGHIASQFTMAELRKQNTTVEKVFLKIVEEKGIHREDI